MIHKMRNNFFFIFWACRLPSPTLLSLPPHLSPLTSYLIPHTSYLLPHTAHHTPHTSYLLPPSASPRRRAFRFYSSLYISVVQYLTNFQIIPSSFLCAVGYPLQSLTRGLHRAVVKVEKTRTTNTTLYELNVSRLSLFCSYGTLSFILHHITPHYVRGYH
jgi:hypothetical protein